MGKYNNLLSPIKAGNHLFKNRIVLTPITPQLLREDEAYPAETLFAHYIERARNGVALVTLSGFFLYYKSDNPMPPEVKSHSQFDIFKGENHYLSQLVEGIQAFGSFATIQVQHSIPKDWDICAGAKPFGEAMYLASPPSPTRLCLRKSRRPRSFSSRSASF